MLETSNNVVWQSADGRVTSDHCRVTVQRLFFKFFSYCLKRSKTLFDSRPTVAWPHPLSRDRSATFFKIFPNRLKRPRNVVWQSSDGRVTSDHCRVTVRRLFSKTFIIAWNVQKTLFDSRPTVAWPPTTVAWPFSDFFNILPNCLKRPKNVVWQSADGRVTSDHCRVTVQRLFSKFSQIAWNVQKTLFDSRPTVAWPPTTVAWPFSDFFQNFRKSLETSRKRCLTVGRRSRDLRLLSRDRSVTFFKNFPNCLKRPKTLFDSRPTVAWPQPLSRDRSATFFKIFSNCLKRPKNVVWQSADGRVTPTTVAWPFSDFFQNFPKSLETSKKRCLTVGRRSRDLRPLSRDRSATFFKFFSNFLKRPKNVVWQSADGRVTSTTVAWPFSDFFQNFPNYRLKRPKNVVWQSADGRVTSDHCRVTVQRLFSKFSQIARNVQKTLFDSRPSVAWPPTTVAWPFSDFFSKIFLIAWNVQKRCSTVGRRSRDLNHCRVTVQRLFSKFF